MSTCLGKMIIEGDQDLGPQLKKMKLSSDSSNGFDIIRANLIGDDLQKELKTVFPYLSEEKIKEILEKSENNSESAKRMINEMNTQESRSNRDFVNLHQQNRKRRFNEMMNTGFGNNICNSSNNESTMNTSNNLTERRKFQFKSHNLYPSQNHVTEEELDKMVNQLEQIKSREEAKDFLKKLVPDLLSKVPGKSKTNDEEMKKMNQTLIADNAELKKCVVTLYRKTQADQKAKEESLRLQSQVDKLQEELLKEKSKNQSMAMLLRQLENSSHNNFYDSEDIY